MRLWKHITSDDQRLAHAARQIGLPLSLALLATAVAAQTAVSWPSQPLTLVIGFNKNSTSEIVASAIAAPLGQLLGQPVNIEILTGKAGTKAAAQVAHASNGHTLGIVTNNALTVAGSIDPQLGYDPDRDLRPVALLSDDAMALVASIKEASSTNPEAFLMAARNAGTGWKYGSQGPGSIGHLGMEYLGMKANMRPVHVPLMGGPEVAQAVISGQVQLGLLPIPVARYYAADGKGLKIVAVSSRERTALLPDVPSLHQSGVTGFDFRAWTVAVLPKNQPEAQVERLSTALATVLADPAIVKKLASAGLTVAKDTSATQAKREIAYETKVLGGIVIMRNIKLDAKP